VLPARVRAAVFPAYAAPEFEWNKKTLEKAVRGLCNGARLPYISPADGSNRRFRPEQPT
jgi:hypothetical protein